MTRPEALNERREGLVPAKCAGGCGTVIHVWGGPLMTTPERPLATWGGAPMYCDACDRRRRAR